MNMIMAGILALMPEEHGNVKKHSPKTITQRLQSHMLVFPGDLLLENRSMKKKVNFLHLI